MESVNDQPAPIANGLPSAYGTRGPSERDREDGTTGWNFAAAIFDMDGVVTDTAATHATAWKQAFDGFLRFRDTTQGEAFAEFTRDGDYLAYVDGRPRYNGVEAFLKSRGIMLPRGTPLDLPGYQSVCGLGNLKNAVFSQLIASEGVRTFESTVSLIREMKRRGIKIGLATSSQNAGEVLGRTGTSGLFATVVDGLESSRRGLKGKPEPDVFVAAAADLGVPCAQAIVVEDAVTGVQAGARGGFALVIGIAREGNALELQEHGADVVVRDLSETSLEQINRLVQDKRSSAR